MSIDERAALRRLFDKDEIINLAHRYSYTSTTGSATSWLLRVLGVEGWDVEWHLAMSGPDEDR